VHARLTGRAALAASLLLTSGVFAVTADTPAAHASSGFSGTDNCEPASSGGTSGGGGGSIANGQITMWTQLTSASQQLLCSAGNTTSASGGTNWQPPQCWWAPEYSPSELAAAINAMGGSGIGTYRPLNEVYASGGPGATYPPNYTSTSGPPWVLYNVGASPGGEWSGMILNENITEQGLADCTKLWDNRFTKVFSWVAESGPDQGLSKPPLDGLPQLTAQNLAYYVAGKVRLNPVTVQTNPSLNTTNATVGLPTWVWAEGAGNTTIKDDVCTQQHYGGICVNLNAQAESFTVSTDDPAATVYSNCALNAGVIGKAYNGGAGDPPCGVKFGTPGSWDLTLDTTWNVTINWTGGSLTLQPPPVTETDVPANVQEVQAVNH
jgi:enoyl reductase